MTAAHNKGIVVLFLSILLVRTLPVIVLSMVTGAAVLRAFDLDPLLYLGGARSMLATGVNEFPFFAPLNFLFIAGLLFLGNGNVLVPVLATACVGWLTVVVLYFLARELFDEKTAVIAAVLCGFYPNLIFYGMNLYPETLAIFFIVCSFMLLVRHIQTSSVPYLMLAGLLWGLASQTRGGLLLFSAGMCFAIILHNRHKPWRQHVKLTGILLASVFLAVFAIGRLAAPFYGEAGLDASSGIGSALHGANRIINCNSDYGVVRGSLLYTINDAGEAWPEGAQIYSDDLLQESNLQIMTTLAAFILQDPLSYLKSGLERLSFLWSPNQLIIKYLKTKFSYQKPGAVQVACLAMSLLFILVLWGGIMGFSMARDPFRMLFMLFVVFYCMLIFFSVGNSKLRLPMMPFFLLYCAFFIAQIISGNSNLRQALNIWAIALGVLVAGNSVYRYQDIAISPGEFNVRQIELAKKLGFPKTAHFLLENNRKFQHYTAQQRMRLHDIEKKLYGEVQQ